MYEYEGKKREFVVTGKKASQILSFEIKGFCRKFDVLKRVNIWKKKKNSISSLKNINFWYRNFAAGYFTQ